MGLEQRHLLHHAKVTSLSSIFSKNLSDEIESDEGVVIEDVEKFLIPGSDLYAYAEVTVS